MRVGAQNFCMGQQEASGACTPRSGEWARVNSVLEYRKEVMLVRDEGEFYLFAAHGWMR
jgi:hypothetical protein